MVWQGDEKGVVVGGWFFEIFTIHLILHTSAPLKW